MADYLTDELLGRFSYDESLLTSLLLLFIFFSLGLTLLFIGKRAVSASTVRIIRDKDGQPLNPGLGKDMRYNAFVSHIWSSAQDQAATIKRQIQILVPDATVFLDVDDLEQIGLLEQYIEQTQVMIIILSKNYFLSKNCMREVRATCSGRKPVVLVHEADLQKGGEAVEVLMDECAADAREHIFGPEDARRLVITWHRISFFQAVSLKLIIEGIMAGCPEYAFAPLPKLCIPSELPAQYLAFRKPVKIYVSLSNPGANGLARILRAGMDGALTVLTSPAAIPTAPDRKSASARMSIAAATHATKLRRMSTRRDHAQATHFVLYLNAQTFVGPAGDRLAEEVRAARASAFPIVMVHENGHERGGCLFGHFFGSPFTPMNRPRHAH